MALQLFVLAPIKFCSLLDINTKIYLSAKFNNNLSYTPEAFMWQRDELQCNTNKAAAK